MSYSSSFSCNYHAINKSGQLVHILLLESLQCNEAIPLQNSVSWCIQCGIQTWFLVSSHWKECTFALDPWLHAPITSFVCVFVFVFALHHDFSVSITLFAHVFVFAFAVLCFTFLASSQSEHVSITCFVIDLCHTLNIPITWFPYLCWSLRLSLSFIPCLSLYLCLYLWLCLSLHHNLDAPKNSFCICDWVVWFAEKFVARAH